MQTKVKVNVAQLLDAVKDRRTELVTEHAKKIARYETAEATYRALVIKKLRTALERVEKGGTLPDFDSYDGEFRKLEGKPSKPNLDLKKIDQTIKTLGMASEESISIGADDYSRYLG